MRVLSVDPGAKRAGWAVLDLKGDKLTYIASGIVEFPKPKKIPYQGYRMALTSKWITQSIDLIDRYDPEFLVIEEVPVYGMNDFAQGYLANVMATTTHAVAIMSDVRVVQMSANKVHKAVAIPGKSKKITKVQVRNGVVKLLPTVEKKAKKWTKVFEESDALAIGLTFLGYRVDK